MPEADIGLFTDVGAGYFLPRAVNNEICFALYLALTGRRLYGKELVHWGLATHYVEDENLEEFKRAIVETTTKESSHDQIMAVINGFATLGNDYPRTKSHPEKI